jgi:hypothetical protein
LGEHANASPGQGADDRWWRRAGAGPRDQQNAERRALADALAAAFGHDFGLGGGEQSQFGFLSAEKRDALRRILQDYDEMFSKYSAGGIQLASDKEKLRLLKAERDRDIAALLTPEEKLAYEMRTSASANAVRNRYGDALESEDDFRKIYALQKAFDEKFPMENLSGRISPETMRQRTDAQRQLQEDIRAAVGDEKYAALRRASDGDLRNIDSLASRLNLPANTTDRVAATRETFATESQRINADTALTPPERRTQIQDLAAHAKTDLTRTLGAEAADAYVNSSPWMSMLQGGMAYSTTQPANSPGGIMTRDGAGPSIYPVLPTGANTAGVARQVVFGGSSSDGGRTADQVMTFTATTDAPTPSSPKPATPNNPPTPPPKR